MTSPAPYVPGGWHNSYTGAAYRQQHHEYRHPWIRPVEWSVPLGEWGEDVERHLVPTHDLPWPYDVLVWLASNHVGADAARAARTVGELHTATTEPNS